MIPEYFDPLAVLAELRTLGWKDHVIERECGFRRGYIAQLRIGYIRIPSYAYAARLLNLLERERENRFAWNTRPQERTA